MEGSFFLVYLGFGLVGDIYRAALFEGRHDSRTYCTINVDEERHIYRRQLFHISLQRKKEKEKESCSSVCSGLFSFEQRDAVEVYRRECRRREHLRLFRERKKGRQEKESAEKENVFWRAIREGFKMNFRVHIRSVELEK